MSNQESTAQLRERLEQEAVAWYARWASGDMTAEEQTQFDAWQNQSPAHEKASRKMQRLWQLLPAALSKQETTVNVFGDQKQTTATAKSNVIPFKAAGAQPKKPHTSGPWRLVRWSVGLSTAASVLLMVWTAYSGGYLHYPWADYRTLVGEQTSLQLSDGSTVYLNTDTAINVTMDAGERRISLLRGEAEFAVAHDSSRPFRVVTGHTRTEAIGTRFVVRYDASKGDVTLLEGKVRSSRLSDHGDELTSVMLKAGERLGFNDAQLGELQAADLAVADAWRRGRLVLNFVALGDVVDEINRYRPGRVLLLDSELAQQKIHVSVDIHRIDDWLDALDSTLPIQVHRAGPIVVLQAR